MDAENGFNRNIVECKLPENRQRTVENMVLIETLWNVNHITIK